jgi:FkbM family methyltransferase
MTSAVPVWAKLASRAIRWYHAWSPIARGKHWMLRRSSPFLVAPVGPGLWVRATGVSGFEWKAFRGQPGEEATAALFQRLLLPGMTVFDVGANVGYYALLAARGVGNSGRVHAFEATPTVARRLAENIKLNRLQNVTVKHAAVCDRSGEVEFRLHEDDSEGNSLVSYAHDWPAVRVPALTLDGYIGEQRVERVDLLKIDVEGAESLVLVGAAGLLAGTEPPLLIVESNPSTLLAAGSSPESLREQLARFGYRCYGIEQLTHGSAPAWNILAVHLTHEGSATAEIIRTAALMPL